MHTNYIRGEIEMTTLIVFTSLAFILGLFIGMIIAEEWLP